MALDTLEAFGHDTPDERLAQLTALGSERAFAGLVERYRAPLERYARRLGVARDDVDDVVQGTFAAAWSALQEGTQVEAVRAWLYRIARHQAIDRHRRGHGRDEPLGEAQAARCTAGDELYAEMATTLSELRELPEAQRRALLGTAVHGRSHSELAAELGVSDTAVRGLVFRARASLRAAVGALVPAPLGILLRRLATSAELAAGGDAPGVAKVVAVTLGAGVLAGGAGVAVHETSHRASAPAKPGAVVRAAAGAPRPAVAPPRPSRTHVAPRRHAPAAAPRPRPRAGQDRPSPVPVQARRAPTRAPRPATPRDPSPERPAPSVPAPVPPAPVDGSRHGADDPAPSSGGHGSDDPVAAVADDHGGTTTTAAAPAPAPAPASAGGADDTATAQPPVADDHGGHHGTGAG